MFFGADKLFYAESILAHCYTFNFVIDSQSKKVTCGHMFPEVLNASRISPLCLTLDLKTTKSLD